MWLVASTFTLVVSAWMIPAQATIEQEGGMIMQLHRRPTQNNYPERYMRRLTKEGNSPELVPLHLGLGTHYTWVYAGTPPQRASVIADTGSAYMAFPCSECDGCGNHTDAPFNINNSSTLIHVTCAEPSIFQCTSCEKQSDSCMYSQSYLEGSTWKASVVEDIVYLGGDASFKDVDMRNQYGTHFHFGCQNAETGLFVTQVADGIMGLSNTGNNIVAKLFEENKIGRNLFSLCFTENGGTMAIGHPFKSAHRGEVSYVKMLTDRSSTHFYNVRMKDVRINNKSINAEKEAYTHGHYIVDSGTTDSYLPRTMKNEFMKAFKKHTGRAYQSGNSCKSFTISDLAVLPTIQFVMEADGDDEAEVVLNVPPEQYLVESNGAYCGSIYLTENHGGVIGANIMMHRDVIFDVGNHRVGFVDADCAFEGGNATLPPSIHKSINVSDEIPVEGSDDNTTSADLSKPIEASTPKPTSTPISPETPVEAEPTSAPSPPETPIAAEPTTAPISTETPALAEPPIAPITSAAPIAAEPSTVPVSSKAPIAVKPASSEAPKAVDFASALASSEAPITVKPIEIEGAKSEVSVDAASKDSIQTYSDNLIVPNQSSLATTGDHKANEKLSATHPLVLTVVGAVLVVGFLVMMLISVSRRRKKDGKEQLWSRVKGDEADEDDDDDADEFGLVGMANNNRKNSTKSHQRVRQNDDDESYQSSSNDEIDVLERADEEETKTEPRSIEHV